MRTLFALSFVTFAVALAAGVYPVALVAFVATGALFAVRLFNR